MTGGVLSRSQFWSGLNPWTSPSPPLTRSIGERLRYARADLFLAALSDRTGDPRRSSSSAN